MRETQNPKYSVPSFIISHCVRSKGIHPRHPPREFPLGLRAPVLGMGTAQIPGNEPFPILVGERILLSPARCLGSCSFQSHSAERNRAHPTRPRKPLSGFSCLHLWYFDILVLHITQALVFSPDTLAEFPKAQMQMRLTQPRRIRRGYPTHSRADPLPSIF